MLSILKTKLEIRTFMFGSEDQSTKDIIIIMELVGNLGGTKTKSPDNLALITTKAKSFDLIGMKINSFPPNMKET